MIFVNRFWLSFPFQREILSVKLNCRNLFIHFNNCISGILRTVRTINSFSDIENHRPQFSLQECASLLQRFSDLRDVNNGKSLHSILIKSGLHRDVFVQNNILCFYAACEELMNARLLFDEMPEPNLISWTSMISAYVQYGYNDLGLQLFSLMCRSGLCPNEFGYSVALKACGVTGNLLMGKVLHGQTLKSGFELCFFCNSSIFNMYVKSWEVDDARKLFNEIPLNERSEALWNTLLDCCVQVSKAKEAINFFHQMLHSNVSPTCFTYAILIKSCTDLWNFHLVKSFHGRTVKVGLDNHNFVGGALVDTYSKLGFLEDAYKVFQELEEKDNVVWSSLLAGFHQSGVAEQGLQLFGQFVSEGHKLDPFIFANAFSLCSSIEVMAVGSQVHCSFIKSGFAMDSFIGSSLINMYVGTGMVCHAYKCFLEFRHKNEICFNAMIAGLTFHSEDGKALELFCKMRELGLIPGHSTISYVLRACANLHKLEEGRAVHSHIVKTLVDSYSNFGTGNALIELYAKCGVVEEAIMVFKEMDVPNEFCWTTIISSYTESERWEEALFLFLDMICSSKSIKPSQFTLVVVLQACTRLPALNQGKQIHGYIIKAGFELHSFVGSALISMYGMSPIKSDIYDASRVFSSMTERDIVSWSAIITAWEQHGYGEEALKLFIEFQHTSIPVDESVLSSCLAACASLVALESGKWIHSCIIKTGFESNLHVGSSIIDMYCKCGSILDAVKFFDGMERHNTVSWTAMITGYAHHGFGKEAIELFNGMKEAGLEPDGVTFIGVLTACSYVGLVKEGWQYFESMRNNYGLDITINHYACMVDLLGRAGQVDEAEALIKTTPFQSKTPLWKTLLGACNKHGNVQVGNRIAKILVELELDEPSTYVLLSNMYASASMWDHSIELRDRMKGEHINKDPGCSWVQVAT